MGLILRIIRSPNNAPSGGTSSSSVRPNICRSLATTTLAVMLRYATFVSPPTTRTKDEHIIPTLVGVLRESVRVGENKQNDTKLRKRAIAALGEILFYISAQDEEFDTDSNAANGGNNKAAGAGAGDPNAPEKWSIPDSALNVLTKALREDSDEIVRHYAAKVCVRSVKLPNGLDGWILDVFEDIYWV